MPLITTSTNKSYRYGFHPETQGVAFAENSGTEWIYPSPKTGSMQIYDTDGHIHNIVLDMNDGFFYDISTRDGPTGTNIIKANKDKVLKNDTGGTDIAGKILFGEDRGTQEKFFLEGKEFHTYIRPESESTGYPTGIEFDLDIFVDGAPTTATAIADDVDITGDISFDKKVEGKRIQLQLRSNMSQHYVCGIQAEYVSADRVAAPDLRITTEEEHQEALSTPDLWADMNNGSLINRLTGATISSPTAATGPDGTSNAFTITAAQILGSTTLAGTGTLLIWYSGAITAKIGATNIPLTTHATSGAWTLAYTPSTLLQTGNLTITPTGGSSNLFDIRTYNAAISTLTRTYYYNDIINNSGNIVEVR